MKAGSSNIKFNQEQSMTIVPNSCLSILFLPKQYPVERNKKVILDLHYNYTDRLMLEGTYMDFEIGNEALAKTLNLEPKE